MAFELEYKTIAKVFAPSALLGRNQKDRSACTIHLSSGSSAAPLRTQPSNCGVCSCDADKEITASHTSLLVTINAIMGASVALALRARGLISILLGIYGAFNPKEFFNKMISPGWEGTHSCNTTLNVAFGRAAMQHGWQLVALGALLLLLAGQKSVHKTATSIAIFASSSAFGVFFGSEGPRGVAMYHLAWCFMHTVSYEGDRRKDKKQDLSDGTRRSEASSDEKVQPVQC